MDQKKIHVRIKGMHCASCEVLIERKFREIPGVEKVHVNQHAGKARLIVTRDIPTEEFSRAIEKDGYTVTQGTETSAPESAHRNTRTDYFHIGAITVVVLALYLVLQQFNLIPTGIGVTDNMGYGLVFIIGLVAATSTCIAVTGGLILAVSAKQQERQLQQRMQATTLQKLSPHIAFNTGRIVSYTLFGALIGTIGSAVSLSPRANTVITIAASIVMILLGLNLLKIFPNLAKFTPKPPKQLAHRIHDLQNSNNRLIPFVLGGATFFLPCGFTQALQLYVLSRGDALTGALTMLVFSLGTLPALLSLGLFASFAKGNMQRIGLKFAGVIVILLGIITLSGGLSLLSFSQKSVSQQSVKSESAQLTTENNNAEKQIVRMKVVGYEYEPYQFTIRQGIPVEWHIDATRAQGCAQVIMLSGTDIVEYLPRKGEKIITFTPNEIGVMPFSCTMGMTTPEAEFTVIPNEAVTTNTEQTKPITN